ncbi:MAG TPA: AAA family ATPase [Blastocatellia bacterium]|nr:AAA family ATPase [Blastocatellia bacterium]
MSGMRFTQLELKNWKNFTDVTVKLAGRVFLVGPNATGKSNFLDAFRFLRDLVIEGGGLSKAIELRDGIGKVRSLFARRQPAISIMAVVQENSGVGWRYELEFSHESIRNPRPIVVREIVHRILKDGSEERILRRPDTDDEKDKERLTQTAIQQVNANQNFRELADFFREISYLHLVPQLLREEQAPRANGIGFDPFGRDLLDRIRHTAVRQQKARLRRIEEVLKVVVPELKELHLQVDEQGRPHLQGKFQHWRPQGAYQKETQFSDGTLRLIGLLWALQERAGPLLLEEPELSLHTAIVRRLAPFIYRAQKSGNGRQVILSTHSEQLLADPGIAPEEVLLVQPTQEGSEIISAVSVGQIIKLMEAGVPASQAVLPRTELKQMSLLDRVQI